MRVDPVSHQWKMVAELPKHWKESRHIGDIEAWIKELKQLTRLKNLTNKNLSRRSNWGQWQYPIFCFFLSVSYLLTGDFLCEFHLQNLTYFQKNRSDAKITTSFTRYWLLLKVQIQYAIFFLQMIKVQVELVCGWGMVLLLLLLRCLWDETWKNTIRMQICFGT